MCVQNIEGAILLKGKYVRIFIVPQMDSVLHINHEHTSADTSISPICSPIFNFRDFWQLAFCFKLL